MASSYQGITKGLSWIRKPRWTLPRCCKHKITGAVGHDEDTAWVLGIEGKWTSSSNVKLVLDWEYALLFSLLFLFLCSLFFFDILLCMLSSSLFSIFFMKFNINRVTLIWTDSIHFKITFIIVQDNNRNVVSSHRWALFSLPTSKT